MKDPPARAPTVVPAPSEQASRWRGRPCWAFIDLDAIEANCRSMRSILRPRVALMGIVKANAYGHGLVGVASAMLAGGATRFGVACVDEGAQLRSAGIDAPILVLGYVPQWEAERVLRLDLDVALTTRQLALALASAAARMGRPASVHIKVDTGMGRYGLLPEEIVDFVQACAHIPGLRVEALFTHLATAEDPDQSHALRQLATFEEVSRALESRGLLPSLRHALNSAGTVAFPDHQYGMVRDGISLYGVPPGDVPGQPALRPALSLHARVARIRRLGTDSRIGYGGTFVTTRPTDVALLPIGYADGLSRALSGRGWVLVNGRRAPIIGRISMDQTTVDVTDAGVVRQDDEVTLLGRRGEDEISADEMACWRGTIAYEVLTGLPIRVPRLYTRGGQPVAVAEYGEQRRIDY